MNRRHAIVALASLVLLAGCGGGSQPAPPHPPVLGSLASSGAGHRFYEIYEPAGKPRGTILMFHGGGWEDTPGLARKSLALTALALRNTGWRVVNASYTSGYVSGGGGNPTGMLDDVVAFYDQVHRAFGGRICVYGESAGGHLAAMVALERPSVRCLILNAAPLDLVTLQHQTIPDLQVIIKTAFGTALKSWSPALLWNLANEHARVFATAASNDTIVPSPQLTAFTTADPSVNSEVVRGASAGASNAVPWMHSVVDRTSITARLLGLDKWLNGIAPVRGSATATAAPAVDPAGAGIGCANGSAPGWRLMRQGDDWQLSSSANQPIAATRGCSGSAASQEDGLSLWALPGTASLPAGAQASIVLHSNRALSRLSVSFRGFLARRSDWVLALYALQTIGGEGSAGVSGAGATLVAGCNRGACSGGLSLVRAAGGSLLTSAGSHANPDASDTPPNATFTLPAGTRVLDWQLRCANPSGCSTAGAYAHGHSARARDPLGQPAIFSMYGVSTG